MHQLRIYLDFHLILCFLALHCQVILKIRGYKNCVKQSPTFSIFFIIFWLMLRLKAAEKMLSWSLSNLAGISCWKWRVSRSHKKSQEVPSYLEVPGDALDVSLEQLLPGLPQQGEGQAEDDLAPLAEEAVQDPAGQRDGDAGGEESEEPSAGEQVGLHGLGLELQAKVHSIQYNAMVRNRGEGPY